ncbi:MAG: HemK2/MTQ2 family protein methyltransferase [Candidatus Bathyarchaeota archaeon]
MSLLDETKRLLRKNGLYPRRSLGQNFCIDKKLLEKMITFADLCVEDIVLEVGSGFGFLTNCLMECVKKVIAVERDPKLVRLLKERLGNSGGVTIVTGNILEAELPSFNKVVANPPYSISSELILFLYRRGFERAVLTLQKEFAEKLNAQVSTRNYGFLAVLSDYMAQVHILDRIPRESFYPSPKVESVIVAIETHAPKFKVLNKELFFEIVSYLFTQRNRKVRRPLESFLVTRRGMSKGEATLIMEYLPFTETRVRDMKPEDFGNLSERMRIFLECRKICYKKNRYYVFPEVYEPAEDTYLMAEKLEVKQGEKVLDIGTGCGIFGIMASEKAERVVAIDINPNALKCAQFNAKLNKVNDKIDVILSDLFGGFNRKAKFDLIFFNPPYLPLQERTARKDWLERAWDGGWNGREPIEKFLVNIKDYLTEKGRVFFLQSSLSKPEMSVKKLREMGFETKIVAEEDLFFEKIVVIQAEKSR